MTQLYEQGRPQELPDKEPFVLHMEQCARDAMAFLSRYGLNAPDGFAGVSVNELTRLGSRILESESVAVVYDILAEQAKNGDTYYDIVIGSQHRRAREVLSRTFGQLEQGSAARGIDLAAGTGLSSLVLVPVCDHVTAVDINLNMLRQADWRLRDSVKRKRLQSYETVVADVTSLDIPEPERYDIALAMGLQAYLTWDEQIAFWDSVPRILKPGGRYYEYQADNPEPESYATSPRAHLVGELARAVLSFTNAASHLKQRYSLYTPPPTLEVRTYVVTGMPYYETVTCFVRVI